MSLPGGYVQQEKGSEACFTACVSMLTGIDYELLPVLPPQAWWKYDTDEMAGHVEPHPDNLNTWVELMADNGFELKRHSEKPTGSYIVCVFQYANLLKEDGEPRMHALAYDAEEDTVIDPIDTLSSDLTHYLETVGGFVFQYVTVTPL